MSEENATNASEKSTDTFNQEQQQSTQTQTDTSTAMTEQAKTTAKKSEATYSKIDYDSMAVKQYNAGITKAMKDAGFDGATEDDFKKNLKAFKQWQDSQKTELQLAQEAAETAKKEKDALQEELNRIKQETFLQKQGVPADMIEFYQFKISKLVTDDTDFETAGANFIKDNPWPAVEEKRKDTPPPYILPTQGKTKTAKQEIDMNQLLFGRFKKA